MSPGSASSGPLGRRGSCKTSRERVSEEPQSARGRSKYTSYQNNFKAGRKSSSLMNLCGPRLYKQPATKSNRGIMLNAVEYCVFPGAVNAEAKRRVLEEIARSESKHFLVLFRDAGCQFRALYSFCPDSEQITKLYNSGSKCFSQVHTKHLTVTIDAFTIHNSLWQGKKVQLPSKKDMALVI
ncbi:Short spindle protein 4 [Operophtera brumata]|uniref:Short spindle protein 4 n=1 Tax=Operophtera brumata TaxID=104452 RepID=A0A0L7LE49_OPEBR|nr:Short spindle protein 4 [Operophtera brumata]